MKLSYFLLFVCICFTGSTFAQESIKWDLQRCIDHAVSHNISILQSIKQTEIQENNLKQSKYALAPTLNASSNLNFNVGRSIDPFTNTFENQTISSHSYSMTASAILFNGNRLTNMIKLNESAYQATSYGQDLMVNQTKLAVVTAYLSIVQAEENLKNASSQFDLSTNQLDQAQKMYDVGSIDRGSLLNIQAQLANDRMGVVNAQNQVQLAYNTMMNLLQIPLDESFELEVVDIDELPSMPGESIVMIYEQALGVLPEIQQSQHQLQQAMYSEKVSKAGFYPSINIYGNLNSVYSQSARELLDPMDFETFTIGYVDDVDQTLVKTIQPVTEFGDIPYGQQIGDNFGQIFGLSMSIPIFNGLQTVTQVENAKLNTEIAELQLDNVKTTLRSEITLAYTNLLAARSRYDAAVSSEEAQRMNYEFSEKRFNAGLLNGTDLLNAKNMWIQSQTQLVNAKYEYVFRNLLIRYYQGVELSLN